MILPVVWWDVISKVRSQIATPPVPQRAKVSIPAVWWDMKEFIKRTVTAVILIVVVYLLIKYLPLIYFSAVLYVFISAAVYEFVKLANPGSHSILIIFVSGLIIACSFTVEKPELLFSIILVTLSAGLFFLFSIKRTEELRTFVRDIGIHFLAIFYLYIPLYFIFELKKTGEHVLLFLIFVIAVGDSAAYFIGRAVGKHKIYPVSSPNKSLEGLISAIVFAGASAPLSILIFPVQVDMLVAIGTGGVIGLFSQLSDPVESLFKRAASKKDSSGLLPGHGGILDRMDSYIFCAPVLYYIVKFFWM